MEPNATAPNPARPTIISTTPTFNNFASVYFFNIGRYEPPANRSTNPTVANTRKLSSSDMPNADLVSRASVASKLAKAKIARK